jgi:hypothetical protein
MKMLAVIALATAIASPALAQAPQARDQIPGTVQPPAEVIKPPIVREPAPRDTIGRAAPAPQSPNPGWDVYGNSGRYKGSDPDPLVRDQIRRDTQSPGDSLN